MASVRLVSSIWGATFAVAILVQPTPVQAANPSQWAYEPSKCLQDAGGKRYIAIGATVLAIPPDLSFVEGAAIELDKSEQLMPPNAKDQLGCPGNPNQVLISFPLRAIFPGFSEASQALGISLQSFGLPSMREARSNAPHGKPIIPEQPSIFRDSPEATDDICKRPGASVIREDGIQTCRWPSYFLEPGTAYVVDPKVYPTPAGDPFRVHCGIQAYNGRLLPCYVDFYATATGLAIGYAFFLLVSIRTSDFIQKIITFDRQIRDGLSAAAVSSYPWRTAP